MAAPGTRHVEAVLGGGAAVTNQTLSTTQAQAVSAPVKTTGKVLVA